MDAHAQQDTPTTHQPVMDCDNPEECKVCYNIFEETDRRPRTLPCGHTFCSLCVGDLIVSAQLTCPNCRITHSAMTVTQFPVNYSVELIVRKLKAIQRTVKRQETVELPAAAAAGRPSQSYPGDLSKKILSVIQEQKSIISGCVASYQEAQSPLDEYLAQLGEWKAQHHQLLDRLNGLVDQNKAAVALLEEEEASVTDMKNEGKEGNKQLEDLMEEMETVRTASEVYILIDDADQCSLKAERWTEKCQRLFPDVNTVRTSQEVLRVTRKCLERVTAKAGAAADPVNLDGSDFTIMEKVKEISGEASLDESSLTVEELCRMSKRAETMVKNDTVWTYKIRDGRYNYSKMTLENNQLYLHSIEYCIPPGNSVRLPHSAVVDALGPASLGVVFLDLWWSDSFQGRVHIQLDLNLPLAKKFYLLCSGEEARHFKDYKFHHKENPNSPGEYVRGLWLPEEFVDFAGGSSAHAGAVWVWCGGGIPRVCITTRDGVFYSRVFGKVVSGLDVLRAVETNNSYVEDSGIVFTL